MISRTILIHTMKKKCRSEDSARHKERKQKGKIKEILSLAAVDLFGPCWKLETNNCAKSARIIKVYA